MTDLQVLFKALGLNRVSTMLLQRDLRKLLRKYGFTDAQVEELVAYAAVIRKVAWS